MKDSFKVVRDGDKVPFQLGTVVESLQGAGLSTDDSVRLARGLEKGYRGRNTREVRIGKLQKALAELVEAAHGADAAARFTARARRSSANSRSTFAATLREPACA